MKPLKLNKLDRYELSKREQKQLRGGQAYICGCGCNYGGSGGSAEADNKRANIRGGVKSPGSQTQAYFIHPQAGVIYTLSGQVV